MKKAMISTFSGFAMMLGVAAVSAGDQHMASGVIKGVKLEQKKLTISHGPIKALGMEGMTMDFSVYDPAMLTDVKEGQKVSFSVEKDRSGNLVIVDIE